MRSAFVACVLCVLTVVPAIAQSQIKHEKPKFTVKVSAAEFLGKTLPVSELTKLKPTSPEKEAKAKMNKQVPPNFKNRKGSNAIIAEKEHQGADPLRQMGGGNGTVVEPIVNIDGIGDFGSPHDPTGEVGLDHFVQAVNVTDVGVFNKDGDLLDEFAMATLWSGLGVSSAGDPIVLYDETAERWVITEFTFPANLLVAVSETSDPLGSYNAWNFSTPEFPDYPKYSIWPDSYLITTNESGQGIHTQYFLDRNAMLNGEASITMQQVEVTGSFNTEQGFIVSTPVDWDGQMLPVTDPMVLSLDDSSWGNADDDSIRLITFDVDFDNANNTTVDEISLVCTPYDSYPCSVFGFGFQCAPQMDGDGLDAIPEVIMNIPKYRNFGPHESIVCCFVTDVTNGANLSGVRWMEMRRELGGEWEVYQEGTYAPNDGYDRYMGSVAIDEDGNIGLGYTVSSENLYAGLRYTGRYESDPLGTMTVEEYVIVEGEGPIDSGGRYGDYAHMSVDPVNGNTFWFTSEYARDGGSGVGTRICAFELLRDTFDLAVTQIISPITSASFTANELLTIEVKNVGLEPISNFTLSFDFQGIFQESVLITSTLNPEQTYVHQFTQPMNMNADGAYDIAAHVSHPDDTGDFNNTLTAEVWNLLNLDAEVDFSIPESVCGTELLIPFTIINLGADLLTSGNINIYINGVLTSTVDWSGSIPFGASDEVNVNVTGLSAGVNNITLEFVDPNGGTDELPANNSLTQSTNVVGDGGGIQIIIHTDGYPEETTWELQNDNGVTIIEGGPYTDETTDYVTEVCLNPGDCYTFVIYDSFGDGICCDWGSGYYQIIDQNGNLVANGGNFGLSQATDFCLDDNCLITAEFDVTTDSGLGDGAILITASNGIEQYQYSIDGGETYQSDPLFEGLEAGQYDVVVLSGDGICTYEETVTVLLVSVDELSNDLNIVVKPNPNDGFFQVEITGVTGGKNSLRMQVIDSEGRLIQERMISRYDSTYVARISIMAYANGVYYLRFLGENVNEMVRVVKK